MKGVKIEQAVILAGGRGERLRPFTDDLPKPLFPVNGVPFIYRLIEQVKSFGIGEVAVLAGYRARQLREAVGSGEKFGVSIRCDEAPESFDTAERLLHCRDMLREHFLLMYCDNYCPVDFARLTGEYIENDALVQLCVYANKDLYTKDNLSVEGGKVVKYDRARSLPGLRGVDIGYAAVNRKVLDLIGREKSFSAMYPVLAGMGRLYATVTEHRYYSIGSYDRLSLTEEFFREKKVVFLDRDGTLNVRPPKARYILRPEDFKWLPGAAEAVKKLKDSGATVVLVSNQPGIARGCLTKDMLGDIHGRMQEDLKSIGAHIDRIYVCPHGWDDGCECRKPKPGMLFQAQKDLSLDLTKCTLFGDDERDIEAASAAGCTSVRVSEDYPLAAAVEDYLKGKFQ